MILTIIYFVALAFGVFELYQGGNYNPWVVWLTIMASWLCGMQWGELVEKIQHLHHLWNSPFGSGSSIQHRD